jgi:hypothetical protein
MFSASIIGARQAADASRAQFRPAPTTRRTPRLRPRPVG